MSLEVKLLVVACTIILVQAVVIIINNKKRKTLKDILQSQEDSNKSLEEYNRKIINENLSLSDKIEILKKENLKILNVTNTTIKSLETDLLSNIEPVTKDGKKVSYFKARVKNGIIIPVVRRYVDKQWVEIEIDLKIKE